MKSKLKVLAALKIAYAKTFHKSPIKSNGGYDFTIRLTDDLLVSVAVSGEIAYVNVGQNKGDGEAKRFMETMNKILGFTPYCLYKNTSDNSTTLVWIEKNQEANFEKFKRLQTVVVGCYGLTKL